MTLGTQWSWKPHDQIKAAADVIHILAQCAGGDGNLLLDVGAMPDGRIEPRQVEVLKQVGVWMDKYGESIYGTRGGPWEPTRAISSTRKGEVIYVHVLHLRNAPIELPDIPVKIKSAALMDGGDVDFAQQGGKLILTVPPDFRNPSDTVVKLKLARSAMDLPRLEISQDVKATASNTFQNDSSGYGPQRAFDEDSQTRWATDSGTKQAWIAADFGKPQTFSGVRITEALTNRVQSFQFQYRAGGDWEIIFAGTSLGEHFRKSFLPVTAREFRLNILDATDGPTICEIELLK
jgi:alpha-L-fucosidase